MRAEFAEQEMQLSELGELEMSAGNGDAAAARGLVLMEGEPAGPIQHSCANSFPLQVQGLREKQRGVFSKEFSLAAFERALASLEQRRNPNWTLRAQGRSPGSSRPPPLAHILLQLHRKEPNAASSFKKSLGRTEHWCKSRGLEAAVWEHRQCAEIVAFSSAAIRVELQKLLRGLDIFDHICSCASCNREEKSKRFVLGSNSEPGRERSLGTPRLGTCSEPAGSLSYDELSFLQLNQWLLAPWKMQTPVENSLRASRDAGLQ